MSSPVAPAFPYDLEWSESLVGLPMAVPEYWWPGYSSSKLCLGKIASIDTTARELNIFVLVLKDEPGKRYGMRYDAVLLYSDENDETTSRFHLPSDPPADPAQERSVTVTVPRVGVRVGSRARRRERRRPMPPLVAHTERDNVDDSSSDEETVEVELLGDDDSDDEWLVEYTDPDDWILVTEENIDSVDLPHIQPIPYEPREGEGEEFDVKVTEEEVESLKDDEGHIRYEKVFEFLLPDFEGEGYYEWIAARVRNYMTHLIRTQGYTPTYFKPEDDKVVLGDHIACFFGVQIARMLRGFPSIRDTWSTREALFAIGMAAESMPRGAFEDINRCFHFADDWDEPENENWEDIYLDDKHKSPAAAKHRRKFAIIEDAHNAAWKLHIKFGKDLTYDESRCAGWYPGPIVIGPEPKPIRTGATIHSMCVTKGPLGTYMLHVRVYGGKNDTDLRKITRTVGTQQVFIKLLEIFLRPFMGRGCCATMDSAYIGELLAQVATNAWKINVVGTTQCNRCGPDKDLVKSERKMMKKGTYECKFFVHETLPLCVALWADNNIVQTLTNMYPPAVLTEDEGVFRRKRNADGGRDRISSAVKIPLQTKAYVSDFDKIDKRNLADSKYDLKGHSKKHNWAPKLINRFYNINSGCASVFYERLCELYTPGNRIISPKQRMADLAHSLTQRGLPMRQVRFPHPPIIRDMTRLFDNNLGIKRRSDARGTMDAGVSTVSAVTAAASSASRTRRAISSLKALRFTQQKRSSWRHHQSIAYEKRGRCAYAGCPGLSSGKSKEPRKWDTNMRCEECSAIDGYDVFLCNGTKGLVEGVKKTWKVCTCHIEYHNARYNNK